MTLTFDRYNQQKSISVRISDLIDRWNIIVEYQDDFNTDGDISNVGNNDSNVGNCYPHYISAIVYKDFYTREPHIRSGAVFIIGNTFHDPIYTQSWYKDMILGLFTSGLFTYYIDRDVMVESGLLEGQDPMSHRW